MATSKQSFVRATEPLCSVSAQREEETHVQAPLTTMFVHNVPTPGLQPYPQVQTGGLQDATVVPLFLPRMCSNSTLHSLTLHIPSRAALQQQRLVAPATSARTKSVGKHICPHCGKDCQKPSVLEKHLRCHTGERPYPCTTCGISFKTQSNLYKHKRTQAHARLSIESDKGTFSSQESMESSKDNFTSSSEMDGGDSVETKRSQEVLSVGSSTIQKVQTKTVSGIEWALHHAAVVGFSTTPVLQEKVSSLRKTVEHSADVKSNPAIQQASALSEDRCTSLTSNRTPLQRQEALFSKPWDSPISRGKSQSHDSTDSGFSDSSEHHSSSSPGASLHDPSMESLKEITMERHEPGASQMPSEITPEDSKSKVSIQEKQKLEERISKLIYENSVLVDNKQLENVRPRKTILSKQGSIDLPVPYTYKDSFHFEIRNSKHIPSSQNQERGGGAIHSTVPTQPYTSLEHAPLTRSSSLPFTMGGKPTDGAMNLNLNRRCSAGHVYPIRSSNQQATGHRSLVRQIAVDCLPGAERSPIERGSMSSLSSDGDSTDFGTEPRIKGNYKKKARKFDYTKWHTYKGGTFRKLYNSDKDCPLKTKKSSEPTKSLESQTCQQRHNGPVTQSFTSDSVVALQNDFKVSHTNCESNNVKGSDMESNELVTQHTDCYIPSERKKQRTGNDVQMLSISDPKTGQTKGYPCGLTNQSILPTCAMPSSITFEARKANKQNVHRQGTFIQPFSNSSQFCGKTPSAAFCLVSMSGTSGTPSGSFSSSTVPEAKTSFPPMYQLKIPCSTDGVSASCSGSALAHSTCSIIPALRQSHQTAEECHLEKSVLSLKQCQVASVVTTFDQSKQDVLCMTTSMPILTVSSSGLKQTNTLSKVSTPLQSKPPLSVPLVFPTLLPPVQHQVSLLQRDCATRLVENQSSGSVSSENNQPVTSTNTVSTMSFCSESSQQIYSPVTMTPRVDNHSPFPVTDSGKPLGLTADPKSTMHENTLDCTASKMPTGDVQGSQSEEKVILLNGSAQAQNTFYVRTADLQIVMQLISDEQLALIEPHIETTTTAVTLTTQASLSQEVYRNDVTVCVAQKMIDNEEIDKTNVSRCCESASSASKAETVDSLKSQNVKNYANAIPQCVSSWSHLQTKFHISASADYNKNSKQQLYEPQKIPESFLEKNSGGFEVTTESSYKLVAVDKLSQPHMEDKRYSRRENDEELQNFCEHKTDTVSSSEDQTSAEITIDNQAQTIKNSDPLELNETDHLTPVTLSGNGESVHTKTTTQLRMSICEKKMSATQPQQMQKVLNPSLHPSQNKSYLDSKEMRSSDSGKLSCKHGTLVIETFCPSQTPTQYEFFALGPGDFGNDSYGQVKASCPVPNRTFNICSFPEDSTKCGNVVHPQHANLEIFTGHPGEDGTWTNLRFQRDPGTGSMESMPKEHENGGEEGKRPSTEVADMNDTCKGCKDTDKQDKRKEEATSFAEHQAHLHSSQKVPFNISESLLHEKINPEISVCANILSQTCQLQGQAECNTREAGMGEHLGNSHSQETGQKDTSSMCVAKYTNQTCRQSPSLNAMQSEFQKETQARGAMSYWIYSKGSQSQLSSQHKTSATTVSLNCSVSKPETVNAIITSSSSAGPSSCNALQMTLQETHTHQPCPPAIHSNSKELKQFYLGNKCYLEHEDSNSSSDDEQKLVIELE